MGNDEVTNRQAGRWSVFRRVAPWHVPRTPHLKETSRLKRAVIAATDDGWIDQSNQFSSR